MVINRYCLPKRYPVDLLFFSCSKNILSETDARELFKMLVALLILLALLIPRQPAFLMDALPFCKF